MEQKQAWSLARTLHTSLEEPNVIYAGHAWNYDLVLNTKLKGLHIDSIFKIDS